MNVIQVYKNHIVNISLHAGNYLSTRTAAFCPVGRHCFVSWQLHGGCHLLTDYTLLPIKRSTGALEWRRRSLAAHLHCISLVNPGLFPVFSPAYQLLFCFCLFCLSCCPSLHLHLIPSSVLFVFLVQFKVQPLSSQKCSANIVTISSLLNLRFLA